MIEKLISVRRRPLIKAALVGSAAACMGVYAGAGAYADEPTLVGGESLIDGGSARPGDTRLVAAGGYKKNAPWKIGMSHFGLSNTWTIQMARESQYEASLNKNIGSFLFRDAALSQVKQVADIEDLIAQNVDALIITPLTPTSADAGIEKAVAAGIPVVVHTGLTKTDAFTVDIDAGGAYFGRVGGEFLVKQLGGKGSIWVLRGVPGHPEDIHRYEGLRKALDGSAIKIVAEDYGNWEYDGGKRLCEAFYLSQPDVQGVWSSGADMSRACVDVFKEYGATIPPVTGEGNNGFFKLWRDNNLTSVSPVYGPALGAAGVRAAVFLLEGQAMHKRYVYFPPPILGEHRSKYLRDDLSDAFWFPSILSEQLKQQYYGVKK